MQGFRHPAVAPLVQLDANLFTLELFHGPTLAFKDLAMQLLARLVDHALKARGQRATIIGATSGDTGAAAIEAFSGLSQVDVFILYPHGRVSDVQRRQMTTVGAANVHAIAIEGSFDDAQAAIKALFAQQGAARKAQSLRRQLDQLGAHPRPDRLLLHQRRRARRALPAGLLRHADGQFRRYFRRLHRQAHGPADRAAGHRLATPTTSCRARWRAGPTPSARCGRRNRLRWTFRFRPISSGCCSRPMAATAPRSAPKWPGWRSRARSISTPRRSPPSAPTSTPSASARRRPAPRSQGSGARRAISPIRIRRSASARRGARPSCAARETPLVVLGTAHAAKFPDAIEAATGVAPGLAAASCRPR